MTTPIAKAQCFACKKETRTLSCQGCLQNFCRADLEKHFQILAEELDQIENDHDQFRQKLDDHKTDVINHSTIQQINQWEKNAIQIIRQTADRCRQNLTNYINKVHDKLDNQLNNLGKKIQHVREENEFNEIDLNQFQQELTKLNQETNRLLSISIKQEPTSFVSKIFLNIPLNKDTKWKQDGLTIAGVNGLGNQLNQLHCPRGICIDDDETLYIADWNNHCILEWKPYTTNVRIVAGGNGQGNQINQLYNPTDVIVDKENNSLIIADRGNRRIMRWSRRNNTANGEILVSNIDCRSLAMDTDRSLYVSDYAKHEVRRWKRGETNGTIVAGGNGQGDRLNQLSFPSYIFVDEEYSLYVSDANNQRVMKWLKDAKEGIVVAGGNGQGTDLTQLSEPQGIVVDEFGQIYVAEWENQRVTCWCEEKKEGTIVIGGNGDGNNSNQFSNPQGLSFDREGNLYVADCNNNRIQKFEVD